MDTDNTRSVGEELPLALLEEQVIALASDLAAAESRWLHMVAEFDRREGWAGVGVKSCAHWLSWRCGFGLKAAREKVRVARALTVLPQVADAFEKGELSYCRTRAITRVANPANEEALLEMARHSTGAQLEHIVRATLGVKALDDVAERASRRSVNWHWDDDGSLIFRARLDPVEGAALVAAIEAAQAADFRDTKGKPRSKNDASEASAEASAGADGEVAVAHAEQGDGGIGTDLAPDLSPDLEPDLEPAAGSAWELQMGHRVDALVAIAEAYVGAQAAVSGADVYQVVVHVAEGAQPHLENGPAVPVETAMRLACDASIYCVHVDSQRRVIGSGGKTRAIPKALRRTLWHRDGGCRFPGCGRRRRVDGHHIVHWTDGGPTQLHNLVLLCRRHHGLVHEGRFGVSMGDDGQPRFTRPDGTALLKVPLPTLSTKQPRDWHRRAVAPTAVDTRWAGDLLDLSAAVDAVLQAERWAKSASERMPLREEVYRPAPEVAEEPPVE